LACSWSWQIGLSRPIDRLRWHGRAPWSPGNNRVCRSAMTPTSTRRRRTLRSRTMTSSPRATTTVTDRRPTGSLKRHSVPMGPGSTTLHWAESGFRRSTWLARHFVPTRQMGIGCSRSTVGPGKRSGRGAGRHFTTAAGTIIKYTDGTGCLTIPGLRHGLTGRMAPAITGGALWRPVLALMRRSMADGILMTGAGPLFRKDIWEAGISEPTIFHALKTRIYYCIPIS